MSESEFVDLNFDDCSVIALPVSVKKKKYFLCEASEDAARQYRNCCLRATKMKGTGEGIEITGIDGIADAEPLLVSLCLFAAEEDGSPHGRLRLTHEGDPDPTYLVSYSKVLSWRSKIVKPLFENAKRIGDLGEEETSETLEKRIKKDTEKLKKLQESNGSDPTKKLLAASPGTSG